MLIQHLFLEDAAAQSCIAYKLARSYHLGAAEQNDVCHAWPWSLNARVLILGASAVGGTAALNMCVPGCTRARTREKLTLHVTVFPYNTNLAEVLLVLPWSMQFALTSHVLHICLRLEGFSQCQTSPHPS